jgi:hypothetical protein
VIDPVILESTITCPNCGTATAEIMPTDACQFFYECGGCGSLLRPKPGDCCVFVPTGRSPARRFNNSNIAATSRRVSSFALPDEAGRNIYREKVTGAHSDRRELLKMLKVKTSTKIGSRPPPLSLSLELPHNRGANPMQPPDIQAIIAAILTLAATPLQDRQPGTTPEALVVRTFTAIFQVLTGQAPQMSPAP